MKKNLLLLLLLFIFISVTAQEKSPPSFTLGYFAPYGISPGVKAGADLVLKNWSLGNSEKENSRLKNYTLVLQPQVGFYNSRLNYSSVLVNAGAAIKRQAEGSRSYFAVGAGLGYLARFQITSYRVNFQGEIIERQRERQDFLLPTVNVEYGIRLVSKFGLYARVHYGKKFSSAYENSAVLFTEAGIRYWPGWKKESTNEPPNN